MTAIRSSRNPPFLPEAAPTQGEVFRWLTGLDASRERDALSLGHDPHGQPRSASDIADHLASLLGVRKRQSATLLGVSESTISRRSAPSRDLLDRAHTLSELYSEVASVLGAEGAPVWLASPNAALDGHPPLALAHTRAGTQRVLSLIHALQDGAYL